MSKGNISEYTFLKALNSGNILLNNFVDYYTGDTHAFLNKTVYYTIH
jgi:hypothetical protein